MAHRDARLLEPLCARLADEIHTRTGCIATGMRTPHALREACARLAPCLETAYSVQRLIDTNIGSRPLDPDGVSARHLLEGQVSLGGQEAVLASYVDSLRSSVGVARTAQVRALEALADARKLHQRLEAALEGARVLLIEHDAMRKGMPSEVFVTAQGVLERLRKG